mmetsp:Transcript_19102/g.36216  ORF Transcript_19102/g.36216 Transcript_19102/m.36216 type:complete len:278 (-) Transcript_19102:473-1306(-)
MRKFRGISGVIIVRNARGCGCLGDCIAVFGGVKLPVVPLRLRQGHGMVSGLSRGGRSRWLSSKGLEGGLREGVVARRCIALRLSSFWGPSRRRGIGRNGKAMMLLVMKMAGVRTGRRGGSSAACRNSRHRHALHLGCRCHGVLLLQLCLDAGFPKPLAVVDEPISELLQFDPRLRHDLGLFLLGGVGMLDVRRMQNPGLEVLHRLRRQGALLLVGGGCGGGRGRAARRLGRLPSRSRRERRRVGLLMTLAAAAVFVAQVGHLELFFDFKIRKQVAGS